MSFEDAVKRQHCVSTEQLGIPASKSIVDVSIIDVGTRISNIATSVFMDPVISSFPVMNGLPAFSFLIQHPTQGSYVFDLGLRKDQENGPPSLADRIKGTGWIVDIPSDVAETLVAEGIDLKSIHGVIWSHHHWDHTGDPSKFPATTDLIVGPGFKSKFVPAYPTIPNSGLSESAWRDRNLVEVSFGANSPEIGGLRAHDFFGDGSFYLLDAPGHAVGHLMGLARTTEDTFILLAADSCHHPGHFRPSELVSLPQNPPCPSDLLMEVHPHPSKAQEEPFYTYPDVPDGEGIAVSRSDALSTRGAVQRFDASDNVLVILAHDATVTLESSKFKFFPTSASAWAVKGWKQDARWRFLEDLAPSK